MNISALYNAKVTTIASVRLYEHLKHAADFAKSLPA